ncbi:MAG TPA: UDP-glucose 4-epimerase GalE [Bacteriovoracaceae bacterium]|nr:UDP-glucose 4-epimerase GalE [Bacteriovoracaceae bacterium]
MKLLITGGAGYIGSHVVKALGAQNHDLIIYDNLSTGHREAVTSGELVVGDLEDAEKLRELFRTHQFDGVLHFAGSIVVPESVENPIKYYKNNTLNSLKLIELCREFHVNKFIFSSTAAVYGIPESGLCSEESVTQPINPYGQSKLMTEHMLRDVSFASDFRYVALRYFNVAGADPEGQIGQSFPQATHLIKVASELACGKRESMKVFGTDYPTPDGTCVRDYIHVCDLASAHVAALDYLAQGGESNIFNCGYGKGFSVKEVLTKVEEVTGKKLNAINEERRAGDPASLTAVVSKIHKHLDWKPQYDDLSFIIKTAYEWEQKRHY